MLIPMTAIPAGECEIICKERVEGFCEHMRRHVVSVIDDFCISALVTQDLWRYIMGSAPWEDCLQNYIKRGHKFPAVRVCWSEVQEFITRLSEQENTQYRLPTESEWEYAASGSSGFVISDMNGKVWEWVDGECGANPPRPPKRCCRGGSTYDCAKYCCNSAHRSHDPDFRQCDLGFRLACSTTPKP